MSDPSSNSNASVAGIGTAIGASVVFAGLTGLVGAMLMGRQSRKDRAQERIEKRVSELEARAEEAMAQLNRAIEGLSFDRTAQTRAGRKQIRKLSKSATTAAEDAVKRGRKRVAEIEKEVRNLKVAERANRLASEGSDRATALSAALNTRIATLVDEVRHGMTDLSDKASAVAEASSKKATTTAQPVKGEAARLVHDVKARGADLATQGAALVADARQKSPVLAERAKGATHDAAAHAREAAPELREKLADVAGKAAERGGEVVARARERAPEVAGQFRSRAPEIQGAVAGSVSAAVHDIQEHAKPLLDEAGAAAAKAAERARSVARDAGQTIFPEVHHQADAIGDRVSTTTHAIEHKSKQAASAAGRGTKDFTALAVWSAVAGGIAYLALLDEEQQRKVRESGKRVWAEIREVYADIRGYDEEFA